MDWLNQVPPEVWYSAVGAGLTLLLNYAHTRGYKTPILDLLFDFINRTPPLAK